MSKVKLTCHLRKGDWVSCVDAKMCMSLQLGYVYMIKDVYVNPDPNGDHLVRLVNTEHPLYAARRFKLFAPDLSRLIDTERNYSV